MKLNIAVLPGDGIGPEISAQGVEVMSAVCKKFGHEVHYEYALCGADAGENSRQASAQQGQSQTAPAAEESSTLLQFKHLSQLSHNRVPPK